MIFLKQKIRLFYLNQFFNFIIRIFAPRFYQIFETGLSAESHKQHGRYIKNTKKTSEM